MPAALVTRLNRLNPGVTLLDAGRGEARAARLVGCGAFDPQAKGADVRAWLAAEAVEEAHDDHHHHGHDHGEDRNRHDAHIRAFSLTSTAAAQRAAIEPFLDRLVEAHGAALIRAKGLIAVRETPDRPMLVQGVAGHFSPPVLLERWPDADHRSRLVVIGRDIEPAPVERLFAAFLDDARIDTPDRAALTDNPLSIAGFPGRR